MSVVVRAATFIVFGFRPKPLLQNKAVPEQRKSTEVIPKENPLSSLTNGG
jgi:hypothetical protein